MIIIRLLQNVKTDDVCLADHSHFIHGINAVKTPCGQPRAFSFQIWDVENVSSLIEEIKLRERERMRERERGIQTSSLAGKQIQLRSFCGNIVNILTGDSYYFVLIILLIAHYGMLGCFGLLSFISQTCFSSSEFHAISLAAHVRTAKLDYTQLTSS